MPRTFNSLPGPGKHNPKKKIRKEEIFLGGKIYKIKITAIDTRGGWMLGLADWTSTKPPYPQAPDTHTKKCRRFFIGLRSDRMGSTQQTVFLIHRRRRRRSHWLYSKANMSTPRRNSFWVEIWAATIFYSKTQSSNRNQKLWNGKDSQTQSFL